MRASPLLRIGLAISTLLLGVLSRSLAVEQSPASSDGTRPNVVVIYADDLGIGDVSCYGGSVDTPHIDALAASGMRFTRCWAAPLCLPSRAMLLSGRYGFRTGLTSNCCKRALHCMTPQSEITFAAVAKSNGYTTGVFGKWDQIFGDGNNKIIEQWGWDAYCTTHTGGYYAKHSKGLRSNISVDPVLETVGGKSFHVQIDMIQNACLKWMSAQFKSQKPFVVYYPHVAPHVSSKIDPAFAVENARHPPMPITKAGTVDPKTLHKDTIRYLDQQVGQVVQHLRELGIDRKTMIIVTSDNGGIGGQQIVHERALYSARTGTKGYHKDSLVPFIVSWPEVIEPGVTRDALTDLSDVLPTIADVTGAEVPKDRPIDGRSLMPVLRGETTVHRPWIMNILRAKWTIRNDSYQLVGSTSERGEPRPDEFHRYLEEPYTYEEQADRSSGAGKENFDKLFGVIKQLASESPWRFQCAHKAGIGKAPLNGPKDKITD